MKILVVDDHPMFREGLAGVLRQWPPVSSVLQASDGEPALALVAEQPDLAAAIVDLRMSGTGGLVVVAQLRRLRPDLPVLVLSSSEDPEDVRRALAAGAAGYCPKSAAPATLLAALQLVLAGEVYVPPLMAQAPAAPPAPVGGRQRPDAAPARGVAAAVPGPDQQADRPHPGHAGKDGERAMSRPSSRP